MPLPQKPEPQPQSRPNEITQPQDPVKARRELEYRQRVEYLKKLFPQLETMPEWELMALKSRIDVLLAQREEADWIIVGLDIAEHGEEEEEDG